MNAGEPAAAAPATPAGAPLDLSLHAARDGARPLVVDALEVRKAYATADHPVVALGGVSLAVHAGEFVAIMGASGSGKSTLLHLIGGLTSLDAGSILVEGQNLGAMSDRARTIFRRRRMGIIFQDYNLLPTLSAAENVALPWLIDGRPMSELRGRAAELLRLVHLEHRADHRPDALSGGEKQRVAIARALLNDPALILADEPTGNLDSRQSLEVWQLLRRIAVERGKTILMVTHEAPGAAFGDRVVVLKDGRLVGAFEPKGSGDAALVATGYQELAG